MTTYRHEQLFILALTLAVATFSLACEDDGGGTTATLVDSGPGPTDTYDTPPDAPPPDTAPDITPDTQPDTPPPNPPPEWATACPDDGCPGDATCNESLGACEPSLSAEAYTCDAPPTSWSPGEDAFIDSSDAWNLSDLSVRGIRISVVDYNQDGWPDLSVRRGGSNPNDFSEDGSRRVWLLRNNQGAGFEDVTEQSALLQRRADVGADAPSRPAEVIIWGDVNNDGWPDAYTAYTKPTGNPDSGETAEIMINEGDGTFRLGPADSDLRRVDLPNTVSGAAFTDVDRDGQLDLWTGQYDYTGERGPSQDLAYLGSGDGSFQSATDQLGLTTQPWNLLSTISDARAHSLAWGVGACDVDGDGTPDLRASSYARAPNHLFLGEPSDTSGDPPAYANRSVASGFAYDDNTDWSDNLSAQCYCSNNPEAEGCGDVPDPSGINCNSTRGWRHQFDRQPFRLGGNNGTTVCEDIDRDGRVDFLTTTIRHWDVGQSSDPSEILYNNTAYDETGAPTDVSFRRPGREATGLTRSHDSTTWDEGDITAAIFDFDNDARPDIYIGSTDYPGTRGLLYRQTADGTFEQVPPDEGIDHPSSHGVAAADFDRDGDVDLVVGHSRSRCNSGDHCYTPENAHVRLFENIVGESTEAAPSPDAGPLDADLADTGTSDAGAPTPNSGRWLQLSLTGDDDTNRDAIGARVTIEPLDDTGDPVTTPDGRPVRWVQHVDGGHGHYGLQDARTIHAGLGDACRARVTVRWPDSDLTTETYVLPTGHRYQWTQNQPPTN